MAVWIRGKTVDVGSFANNSGIFIGQNVQDGWDSFSPTKLAGGFSMGDFSDVSAGTMIYAGRSVIKQPIYDGDVKGNWNTHRMR